jgi:teichuronic acid biosynthesis glycosyltransferase TuaG
VQTIEIPLVSVIICVFNAERYIGACLRSVLAQTYPHFELIVVNDASTDGTIAEVQKFHDSRIRIVHLPTTSGGPAVPRNRGGDVATGKYLAFLDADDLWLPEKLEKQVALMEAHPEYGYTHTACWKIDEHGTRLGPRHGDSLPLSGAYWEVLLQQVWMTSSTVMVSRESWERIGPFNETDEWRVHEDLEFALRYAKTMPFGVLKEPLAEYRLTPGNISSRKWKNIGRDFTLYIHVYHTPSLWRGAIARSQFRDRILGMAEEGAYYWRVRKRWGRALWFAEQMILLSPFSPRGWSQLLAVGWHRE